MVRTPRTNSSQKTLGIFVEIDGNAINEVNHLLTKTRQMTEYLRTAKIKKKEA